MEPEAESASVAELLALIPVIIGFVPHESLVLVAIHADGRTGAVVRTDLHAVSADLALLDVAVAHVVSDGGVLGAAVAYTSSPGDDLDRIWAALGRASSGMVAGWDTWVVTATEYYPPHHPDERRPVTDLQATQVAAAAVLAGVPVARSREDLARITPAPAGARATATRAARAWAGTGAQAVTLFCRLRDAGGPFRPSDLGRLGAAMGDLRTRDALLLCTIDTRGADETALSLAAGHADLRGVLAPVFRPGGLHPGARADAAEAVLTAIAAHTDDGPVRASALTLIGFLAWWRDDDARAQALVSAALELDAGQRLAHLLTSALNHGMPPGWAQ